MEIKYNFQSVDKKDEKSLIEKINALSATAWFDEKNSSLKTADLCFYENFKLLQATSFDPIPPLTMRYLVGGCAPDWTVIKLDGSNKPIFYNNEKAGLVLNEETIIEYARFVLDSVMTEEGPMRLVETVAEDAFTREPTPEQREELIRLVRPAIVKKTKDGFDLDAIILYGDKVYRAEIDVLSNNGFLTIISEELLAEDMPVYPIFLE